MQDDNSVYLRVEIDHSQVPKGKRVVKDAYEEMKESAEGYFKFLGGLSDKELKKVQQLHTDKVRQAENEFKAIQQIHARKQSMRQQEQSANSRAAEQDMRAIQQIHAQKERMQRQDMQREARRRAQQSQEALKAAQINNQTNNQRIQQAQKRAKAEADIEKALARVKSALAKQSANDAIRELKRVQTARQQQSRGGMGDKLLGAVAGGGGLGGMIGGAIGGIGGAAIGQVVDQISGVVKQGASAWLDYSSKLEQARIGFATMMGSAAAANQHLAELQMFAAKTPFEFADLVQASRTLQVMGTKAEDVIPKLTAIGNAAAAAGGNFQEAFQRAAYAFAEIEARGKLTGIELRQLISNGIPAIEALTTGLKKTKAEVYDMIHKGQITSEVFNKAFSDMAKTKFGDAMKAQSRTFVGAMSNVHDALLIVSAQAFAPIYKAISEIAVRFADELLGAHGLTDIVLKSEEMLGRIGAKIAGFIIDGMIGVFEDPSTAWRLMQALVPGLSMIKGFMKQFTEDGEAMANARAAAPSDIAKSIMSGFQAQKAGDNRSLQDMLGEGKGKGRKVKSELQQLTERLRELKKDIYGFLKVGSNEFKLRFEVEEAERFKRDLETILTLRREIGLPLDNPLPNNSLAARELREELERFKRVKEQVRQVELESIQAAEDWAVTQLTQGIPVVDAATRANIKYEQSVRARMDAEEEATAELMLQSRLRQDALKTDGRETLNVYTELRTTGIADAEDARRSALREMIKFQINFGSEDEFRKDLQKRLAGDKPERQKMLTTVQDISKQVTRIADAIGSAKESTTYTVGGKAGQVGMTPFGTNLRDAMSWVRSQGFEITSTTGGRHNKGSLHPFGRAVDVRTRGKSNEEIEAFMAMAESAGFNVRDERTRPKGQKVWSGPHVHLSFNPALLMQMMQEAQRGIAQSNSTNNPETLDRDAIEKVFTSDFGVSLKPLLESTSSDRAIANSLAVFNQLKETKEQLLDDEFAEQKLREAGLVDLRVSLALETQRLQIAKDRREQLEAEHVTAQLLTEDLEKLRNGDEAARGRVTSRARNNSLTQQITDAERIIELQYEIGHAAEGQSERFTLAWLEAFKEMRMANEDATKSIIRSQMRIADQSVFHSEQARARILEHISSAKGYTEIVSDAFIQASDAMGDGISRLLGLVTDKMGAVGRIINDISTSLFKMVTNQLLMKLVNAILPGGMGGGGAASFGMFGGATGAGGSASSGVGGVAGSFASQFFGRAVGGNAGGASWMSGQAVGGQFPGGGNLSALIGSGAINNLLFEGSGGANITSMSERSATWGDAKGILGSIAPQGLSSLLGGSGLLSNLKMGAAGVAPLAGLGLGMGLGGQSLIGQLLGGAGGLMVGGAATALLAPSLFGVVPGAMTVAGSSSAAFMSGLYGFLTNPLTIGIGAALLVGAFIYNKNKQRQEAEKVRAQAINDTLAQLDTLIRQVRSHRLDPMEALDRAGQIRSEYITAVSAIKDKKTKRIALEEVSKRIDPKINELRTVATSALNDQKRFNSIHPAFATGGIVPGQKGEPRLVLAHGGEIIASLSQQTPGFVQAAAEAGVPGVSGSSDSGSRNSNIYLTLIVGTETQDRIIVNGAERDAGYNAIARAVSKGLGNNDIKPRK